MLKAFSSPVLNRPEEIAKTTRERITRQLTGTDNVIVPPTARVRAPTVDRLKLAFQLHGIHFPVIVRAAGTHTGNIVGIFHNMSQLINSIGPAHNDYIAASFFDYRSLDGLYRKYRVWFIGTELVLQHMLVSDRWNIHMAERERFMAPRDDLRAEERSVLEDGINGFPHQIAASLREIRRRITLDYFGMDFGIIDRDRILLFEANAQMHFVGNMSGDERFDYVRLCKAPTVAAMSKLITQAIGPR
jgi:hypothetical protein